MRKIHPNAKLKTLDETIQAELWDWLCEDSKRTLAQAKEWLEDTHDVETKIQRLSEWRGWYARKVEIELAESEAHEMAEMLSKQVLSLTPEQISAVSNAVFLNRATRFGDAKTFVQVAGVIQRSQELVASQKGHKDKMELGHAQLALKNREMDRKMKELDMKVKTFEAKIAETKADDANPNLTDEDRAQRMRSRFGV